MKMLSNGDHRCVFLGTGKEAKYFFPKHRRLILGLTVIMNKGITVHRTKFDKEMNVDLRVGWSGSWWFGTDDRFTDLENMGWKWESGVKLNSPWPEDLIF